MHIVSKCILVVLLMAGFAIYSNAQLPVKTITKAAGSQYNRSPLYQSLWGSNYRPEWATPVTFPVLMLDTAFGGLTPHKQGGGNQSKSLHLKTKEGKEYVMRSIDKSLKVVIPEKFHNTFIEHIVDDLISMSHPYAALTVPIMADAAKIYHTNPNYFFVPEQPALDTFNKKYGNRLYLVEQRPDGNWNDADNLGNFTEFMSSAKLRENIFEDHKKQPDQLAFVKARLFDMFIGDWDRHEDQWKWAPVKENDRTLYMPVPVDRDQPYSRFDGFLLRALIASEAKYMQSFDYDIPFPEGFSYEKRNIDRFFSNRLTLDHWQNLAKELQHDLTDSIIEAAIHQLPPEIFSLSGNKIIAKLKSRREHLGEYATKYYLFIAKYVDIVGTTGREYFKVSRLTDNETEVNIYNIENGSSSGQPYYSRKFTINETKELRLYGLSGKDIFTIEGNVNKGIRVRIIGGNDKDSISVSGSGKTVQVYDSKKGNIFELQSRARLHLSTDSLVHAFDYDAFRPEKKGLGLTGGFSNEDWVFVGLAYGWVRQSFRKFPFESKQSIGANYSISQSAFSALYTGVFPKLIGGWDLLLRGNYDPVRFTNFYGLGNQTFYTRPVNYFRLRTAEWFGSIGLNRNFGNSNIILSGFFNSVKVLRDAGKFITNNYLPVYPEKLRTNNFLGASVKYIVSHVNDPVVPTGGIIFRTMAGYIENLNSSARSFAKFDGDLQFYIPLIPKISLAIRTGAATVTNTPDFYQYPSLGGGANLRGYTWNRFRGKTTFYNSNELRFITNINSYFLRGKAGLVVFSDNGRVWMPGENSNRYHTSYGGGILIAPFNIIFLQVTYGVGKETTAIQFRSTINLRNY